MLDLQSVERPMPLELEGCRSVTSYILLLLHCGFKKQLSPVFHSFFGSAQLQNQRV
jgi:hypothetical protein